jgi:hypothetical protein
MPIGGLVCQLNGATQLTPTNLLTIAIWLSPIWQGLLGVPPQPPIPIIQWKQFTKLDCPKQLATTLKFKKS